MFPTENLLISALNLLKMRPIKMLWLHLAKCQSYLSYYGADRWIWQLLVAITANAMNLDARINVKKKQSRPHTASILKNIVLLFQWVQIVCNDRRNSNKKNVCANLACFLLFCRIFQCFWCDQILQVNLQCVSGRHEMLIVHSFDEGLHVKPLSVVDTSRKEHNNEQRIKFRIWILVHPKNILSCTAWQWSISKRVIWFKIFTVSTWSQNKVSKHHNWMKRQSDRTCKSTFRTMWLLCPLPYLWDI